MCSVHGGQWTKSHVEAPFLALDQEKALAGEHEEVLLRVLAVVHPARLAGAEDAELDADLVEAGPLGLQRPEEAEVTFEPWRLARVQDVPALAGRADAVFDLLERSFRNHGPYD